MSTCVDQNYGRFGPDGIKGPDGIRDFKPGPGIKVNIGTSSKPFNIMYTSQPPHNVVKGDIYFDTTRQTLRLFDGTSWNDISYEEFETELVSQFEIITGSKGFLKVKLYKNVATGESGVQIEDEEKIIIEDTSKAIEFIKNHTPEETYLWIEKRILEHLS
jgi:hypothetical protein